MGGRNVSSRAAFLLIGVGLMLAQNRNAPVPLWPQSDRIPSDLNGNYVFWDPRAWQIVVVLTGALRGEPNAAPEVVRVPFRNRFDPHISAAVSVQNELYVYKYAVQNGPAAKDSIKSWAIAVPCGDALLTVAGDHCGGSGARPPVAQTAEQVMLPHLKERGCHTTCFTEAPQSPGSFPDHFEIASSYKPGLTTASASNYPPFEVPRD